MSIMSGVWFEGIPVASTAPDVAECDKCGCEVSASDVCCSDFVLAPDGLMEFENATCVGCCGPHPKRYGSGVGYYERMDCDQ